MAEKEGKSVQFIRELNLMLCSKMAVWAVSQEEERFLYLFRRIAEVHKGKEKPDPKFRVYTWSLTEGLLDATPYLTPQAGVYAKPIAVKTKGIKDPTQIARSFMGGGFNPNDEAPILTFNDTADFLLGEKDNKFFIFKDIHNLLEKNRGEYAEIVRKIRDIIFYARLSGINIIFLGANANPPEDFANDIQIIDMPRPDDLDIEELLNEAMTSMTEVNPNLTIDIDYKNTKSSKIIKSKYPNAVHFKQKLIYNLRGLTQSEIEQIIAYVCVKNKGLTEQVLADIKDSKSQVIQKTGFLEYIPTPSEVFVGGHEMFKEYIEQRGLYLDPEFRNKYNLKAPKGALSVGIPGTGKSILAKYIGWRWNVPLIRLDFSAIFGKYLGESEGRLREALKIASANAPCVLWIDEIEKALGNAGNSDSGTSMRVLGKLLTWMAERQDMIYLYCTANTVHRLPPELLRSGRFDVKFWADLPSINECIDIIRIHTKSNGIKLSDSDIADVAKKSINKKLTGAEIEQGIIDANFFAAQQHKEYGAPVNIDKTIIIKCLNTIQPYVDSHKISVQEDRRKALTDFLFTSKEAKEKVSNEPDS